MDCSWLVFLECIEASFPAPVSLAFPGDFTAWKTSTACTRCRATGDISSTLTLRKPSRASRHSAGCASRLPLDVALRRRPGATLFSVLASEVPRTLHCSVLQIHQFMSRIPGTAARRQHWRLLGWHWRWRRLQLSGFCKPLRLLAGINSAQAYSRTTAVQATSL